MSRLRSGKLIMIFGIAAGLLLSPACKSGAGHAELADGEPAVSQSPEEALGAPDITLDNLEGQPVRLSELAGTVQLVDFWATWCAPCREEIPMLAELHETYKDLGLTILAISDEDPAVVKKFAGAHKIPFLNLVENGDAAAKFGVLSLPTAFLIDRDGEIVETYYGPKPRPELEGRIRELLELPPLT